jgi:Aminoglycoside adenylyltransferase, C-terminal domain
VPGRPTPFRDLNDLLDAFVTRVRIILGANFCGAYLQGSFAVGDADVHSDVDFIVVTHGQVSDEHAAALQALHQEIYALDTPWAQHLEGSYAPKEILRTIDPFRTPLLYLDNGATELTRDPHCNTAVVRWTLREHGVVLAGPEPKGLLDPVSSDQLRAEVRAVLPEYATWSRVPGMSRWKQPYLVLSFCRFLHTLEAGTVVSKRVAGVWALRALDPRWCGLVQRALGDRPDPWSRVHQPADAEAVARTRTFVEYAVTESQRLPHPAAPGAGSA